MHAAPYSAYYTVEQRLHLAFLVWFYKYHLTQLFVNFECFIGVFLIQNEF